MLDNRTPAILLGDHAASNRKDRQDKKHAPHTGRLWEAELIILGRAGCGCQDPGREAPKEVAGLLALSFSSASRKQTTHGLQFPLEFPNMKARQSAAAPRQLHAEIVVRVFLSVRAIQPNRRPELPTGPCRLPLLPRGDAS